MAELLVQIASNNLPAMDPLYYDIQAAEAAGCFPPNAENNRVHPRFSTTAWSTKFHVLDEESELDVDEVRAIEKQLCSCNDAVTFTNNEDGAKVVIVCPSIEELSKTEATVECPLKKCRVTLSNSSALSFHLRVHKIKVLSDGEKYGNNREYACPAEECSYSVTGSKRFAARKYVKQHYLKVHAEKSHKCPHCSLAFGFFPAFREHQKTCGQVYRCGMCPRTFLKPVSLTTHAAESGHAFDPFQLPVSAQSKQKMDVPRRYSAYVPPNPPLVIIVNNAAGLVTPLPPPPPPSSVPSPPLILPAPSSINMSPSSRRDVDKPLPSGAALIAARALMELSSTPILAMARPQKADMAVQTCSGDFPESSSGGGRRSRRNSPGRSSRKRTAQVQTKLTAPSKRRVKHSVVQTGAKSPSRAPQLPEELLPAEERADQTAAPTEQSVPEEIPVTEERKDGRSEGVLDIIEEVDTAIADILNSAAALAAERTESPSLNCEIDIQEMERLSRIIRLQNEQQLGQQPSPHDPAPPPPLAFVDACMSTEEFDSYLSREIETQTDLDIFSDDFLSEFTSLPELDEMLSSSTQTLDWTDFSVDSAAGGHHFDANGGVEFTGFEAPRELQTQTSLSNGMNCVELPSFPEALDDG